MKKFGNKGITLIALVVTIIVLIILAGVSISLILGQDGVVQKAKEGRDSYADAARIENEQLANVDSFAMTVQEMIPSTIGGTITDMTDGEIEISATVNLNDDVDFTKTKYVFTTSNSPLGTDDESLYKDGTVEQANSIITKSKAQGTYYLHVLAIDKNGSKSEIISENTATSEGKKEFDYTGDIKDITLTRGNYKLEVWGAQGGFAYNASKSVGGYGGYSYGNIEISSNQILYIVVGGQGGSDNNLTITSIGGYNGGGIGGGFSSSSYGSGGGGATHIATKTGVLKELESYKSDILIVAGGGGGTGYSTSYATEPGGAGGGYQGGKGYSNTNSSYPGGDGGTQSSGGQAYGSSSYKNPGSFGQGGNFNYSGGNWDSCGGGGGYYGGGSGGDWGSPGGGGSGYLNTSILSSFGMYGYTGNNISCPTNNAYYTYGTSNTGVHISNYANEGNGYARITALD